MRVLISIPQPNNTKLTETYHMIEKNESQVLYLQYYEKNIYFCIIKNEKNH